MKEKAIKRNLAGLFFVVFLDLLGVGIIIPVLAPLFYSQDASLIPAHWSPQSINLIYGFLIGIYPIMQFFGAPILGALSDKFGRKKLLSISLFGSMIGYIITGLGVMTGQVWMMFLGRGLDGFTGGNIAVANSAIADMSKKEDRASNFGLIGMAFGLGFIFGPFLGGVLSNENLISWFSPHLPFFVTAGLSFLNLIIISFIFKETLKNSIKTKISAFTGFKNLRKASKMKHMRGIFGVIFFHQLGFAFFSQFFPVYLVQKFGATEMQIGILFGYTGIWIAFGQGLLTRIVSKFAKPLKALTYSIPVLALSILSLLLPKFLWSFWLIKPFIAMSEGVTYPNTTALASNLTSEDEQGETMGIISSIRALGMALPPILASILISINQSTAIISSAIFIFIAWLVLGITFRKKTNSVF